LPVHWAPNEPAFAPKFSPTLSPEETMPPDADVTRVSAEEFERYARIHAAAAEAFEAMARARRTGDYELMGEGLRMLEGLGAAQVTGGSGVTCA
jgi:hypothetical protein